MTDEPRFGPFLAMFGGICSGIGAAIVSSGSIPLLVLWIVVLIFGWMFLD